jgi:hypothetical protein
MKLQLGPANQLDLFVGEALARIARKPTLREVEASYSADRINSGKVRQPFMYQGRPHVYGGGMMCNKRHEMEAIELVPIEQFKGEPTTYDKKLSVPGGKYLGDYARNDPNGFYYGMTVKHGGQTYVCGKVSALLVFEGEKLTAEIPWDETEKYKSRFTEKAA